MEVILLQDVRAVGKAGQKLAVKDGYARNFLIPRGLAAPATPGGNSANEALKNARLRTAELAKEKARELERKLAGSDCRFTVSVGEQGKMYGSVTAADIADQLRKQGIPLEKNQIQLERSLTQIGEYPVPVKLHPEVKAVLKVTLCPKQ